jgi:UPF0755 protein
MHINSKRVVIGGLLLIIGATAVTGAAAMAIFMNSPLKEGASESTIVEVRRGEGPREITRKLRASGVFQENLQEQQFFWLGRILRQWGKIKAGEYEIRLSMNPMEVFSVLSSGVSMAHPVTIREGENMYEIGSELESRKLISKEQFLKLCKDKKMIDSLGLDAEKLSSLEGFLFPNTYFFNKAETPEEMIRQMVRQFRTAWGPKEDARAKELGMSQYQIVTLASMIEKETGAPQERPLIGSVFFNRLKKGMKLQSDPTTIYGIWARYTGNLHKSDLSDPNPYNTYYVSALPFGPIANPGKESIQAALYPATSEYLYFVSQNDGTHQFSRTLKEHEAAIAKFQLDPKAREGKSWRDLKKNNQQSQAAPNHQ